jgi:hypothetical protein
MFVEVVYNELTRLRQGSGGQAGKSQGSGGQAGKSQGSGGGQAGKK